MRTYIHFTGTYVSSAPPEECNILDMDLLCREYIRRKSKKCRKSDIMNDEMGSEDFQIKLALDKILRHALAHPENAECIISELNAISNKFDPDIIEGRKEALPRVSQKFAPRVDEVLNKVKSIVGDEVKVPDLRFQADRISKEKLIPLPNSTRKHKDSLLQWFDCHWDIVEPMLVEWGKKRQTA